MKKISKTGLERKNSFRPEHKIRNKSLEREQRRAFYVLMTPFIVFLLIIKGYPLIWGLYISLTNYTGYNLNDLTFVGLANFKRVFTDIDAIPSIMRVVGIGAISVPLRLIICFIISLMLCTAYRGNTTFRVLFYLPSVIPAVAIALMWRGIFEQNGGLFNSIREAFGLGPINWLGYDYVKTSLIIMMLWTAGGGALTNIAAIKGIPDDLYEAADIEGAGIFTKTFKITIPMISNMLYMSVLTSIIGALQLFAQPVLLAAKSGDGLTAVPIRPVYTYLVHVYQQIFVNMRFGYGMAMVWVIFAIIMIITFILEVTKKYWVYVESE